MTGDVHLLARAQLPGAMRPTDTRCSCSLALAFKHRPVDSALASLRADSAESVPAFIKVCAKLYGPSSPSNGCAVRRHSQCGPAEASGRCEPTSAGRPSAVASQFHSRIVCRESATNLGSVTTLTSSQLTCPRIMPLSSAVRASWQGANIDELTQMHSAKDSAADAGQSTERCVRAYIVPDLTKYP